MCAETSVPRSPPVTMLAVNIVTTVNEHSKANEIVAIALLYSAHAGLHSKIGVTEQQMFRAFP